MRKCSRAKSRKRGRRDARAKGAATGALKRSAALIPPPCTLTELKFDSIKATNRARLEAGIFYPAHVRWRPAVRHVKGEDERREVGAIISTLSALSRKLRGIPSHQFVNWTEENFAKCNLENLRVSDTGADSCVYRLAASFRENHFEIRSV